MDKRNRNVAALGLLSIVAGVLFFWGLYWLLGNPVLQGGIDVIVALDNGGGLKRSDGVQLQGVRVGNVRQVQLNPAGSGVIVSLRLDERVVLPTDTRALVRGDVFGAHTIDLIPGESHLTLEEGDTIRGIATPQIADIATSLSARVESVLASADSLLSPSAVRDVHATASVLPASALELRATFTELRFAAAALRRSAEQVEGAGYGEAFTSTLSEVERSARALTAAAGRMEESIGSFASVVGKIDDGAGTLGRLVNDSSLYIEMNQTLREMRLLTTDIRERPSRYFNVRVF